MSIARITVSGIVSRNPEKRFTSNNVPITTFAIDVVDGQETFALLAKAKGNLAETVVQNVNKSDKIVVEGRLQMISAKSDDGTERKVAEVEVASFEKISGELKSTPVDNEKIVKFSQEEFSDELIGEDEIPF